MARLAILFAVFYGIVSLGLAIVAVGLIGGAVLAAWRSGLEGMITGNSLHDALGLLILAMAVFDVAKYLFEEEVAGDRELRSAVEARQTLTRFMVIVVIAVCLQAIVSLSRVHDGRAVADLLYPTLLLIGGVLAMVGLGVYLRLSRQTEAKETPGMTSVPPSPTTKKKGD